MKRYSLGFSPFYVSYFLCTFHILSTPQPHSLFNSYSPGTTTTRNFSNKVKTSQEPFILPLLFLLLLFLLFHFHLSRKTHSLTHKTSLSLIHSISFFFSVQQECFSSDFTFTFTFTNTLYAPSAHLYGSLSPFSLHSSSVYTISLFLSEILL